MGLDLDVRAHARQRWAARGALAAAGLAVLLPIGFAGAAGLLLVVLGVLGTAITVAALWWVLTLRGPARGAAGVLALATPATVIWLFAVANLLWVVVVSLALWGSAVWAGKFALSLTKSHAVRVSERRTPLPPGPSSS